MEQLGTDFNATGSVMSRAELEDQRRKRGECVTCGRKCFQKKLFKMIPITDHGLVLNGRCLNCNPLDSNDGALPAISRPATQADLARFTRSQNNLRSQGSQLSSSSITPPPEQRQRRSSHAPRHPSPLSQPSHAGVASISSNSLGSGPRGTMSRQSMSSFSSGSGESTGSGGKQNTLRSNTNLETQSVSSRSSSRGRETQFGGIPSSSSSVGGPSRPEIARPGSARSMPHYSQSCGINGRNTAAGHGLSPHADDEEYDEYDNRSFNDEATQNSGAVDYYQRSFHKSSSFRSANSAGSQGSDHSRDAVLDTQNNSFGLDINASNRRSIRRPPSRENSNDGIPNFHRRPSFEASQADARHTIRRPSFESLNHSSHGENRRASGTASVGSYEDRTGSSNSGSSTGGERRTASSQSLDSTFYPPEEPPISFTLNKHPSHPDFQNLQPMQKNIRSTSLTDRYNSMQQNIPPPNESSGGYAHNGYNEDPIFQLLRNVGNNFPEIVKCMQEYRNSIEIQTFALQAISNIELTEQDSVALAKCGIIQVILDSMDNFPDDLQVQVTGCTAIWNASGTPENQRAFVEFGALDVVLHAMSTFMTDAILQEQAIAVLANLGANEQNLEKIYACSAIQKLVETLSQHASNPDVQIKGCLALSNFASHPTDYTKSIVEYGGGSAIVVSMVMHPNNAELQERALRTLRNLSANCDENRLELTNIGGIDAIISAMQVHRNSADVQQVGAWTLSNLAGNTDVKVLIGDCGGIDVIIRAMWVHNDKIPVQEWCSRALYSLSSDLHNSKMILELGGVSAIVNAMQGHVDAVSVQEMGCAVLSNLATDQQSKMRIVDEEALDAVVLAMVLFSDEEKVQERSCQLLLQLSIAENFKAMQASNVGELVVAAAQKFPNSCAEPAERLIKVIEGFIAEYL